MDEIKLSESQVTALNFVEQTFWLEGRVPTEEKIADVVGVKTPTVKTWFKEGNDFLKVLKLKNLAPPDETPSQVLSASQLMVVNMLLNLSDTRSEREKLQLCNVSPQQYAAWRRDPIFLDYMHQRAREQFDSAEDTASQALLKNLKMGDMTAIKFYYEVTGRYNPRVQVDLNVNDVIATVGQILQEEINDPELLLRIADRLSLLTGDNVPRPVMPKMYGDRAIETSAEESPAIELKLGG